MAVSRPSISPRRQPKQQRSLDLYERVISAGARVFGESGYRSTTTNRIAEEAGVSIGSLYQYFPNKDAIVAELIRRHVHVGVAEIASRLADSSVQSRSLAERVEIFVGVTVALHRDDPALHRVLFEEAPHPPDVLEELRQFEANMVSAVEASLASDPEVHVADVGLAAYLTVTSIESITHRYVSSHPSGFDAEALVRQLTALVLSYLQGHMDQRDWPLRSPNHSSSSDQSLPPR